MFHKANRYVVRSRNKFTFRDVIHHQCNQLLSRPRSYFLFAVAVIVFVALGNFALLKSEIKPFEPNYEENNIADKPFEPEYVKCPKIKTKQMLINSSTEDRVKVAVCIIATGTYSKYIPDVVRSGRKHLLATPPLKRAYNVTYIVFTTEPTLIYRELNDTSDLRIFFKPHHGWPWDTLFKFTTYLNHSNILQEFDFIFAMDVDMRFVNEVGSEILGDLVGGAHPEYYDISNANIFPYERRSKLCARIPYGIGKHYFQSTIFGGRTHNFLRMMCYLHQCINSDFDPERGRHWLARYDDESYLNRYFIDHPPSVILNPAYLWPVVFGEPPFTARIASISESMKYINRDNKKS